MPPPRGRRGTPSARIRGVTRAVGPPSAKMVASHERTVLMRRAPALAVSRWSPCSRPRAAAAPRPSRAPPRRRRPRRRRPRRPRRSARPRARRPSPPRRPGRRAPPRATTTTTAVAARQPMPASSSPARRRRRSSGHRPRQLGHLGVDDDLRLHRQSARHALVTNFAKFGRGPQPARPARQGQVGHGPGGAGIGDEGVAYPGGLTVRVAHVLATITSSPATRLRGIVDSGASGRRAPLTPPERGGLIDPRRGRGLVTSSGALRRRPRPPRWRGRGGRRRRDGCRRGGPRRRGPATRGPARHRRAAP